MNDTKIEPSKTPIIEGCPFCGQLCTFENTNEITVMCVSCGYKSQAILVDVVQRHNQLCELVRLGKAVEKFVENPPWDKHPDNYATVHNKAIQACLDMFPKSVEDTKPRGEQSEGLASAAVGSEVEEE